MRIPLGLLIGSYSALQDSKVQGFRLLGFRMLGVGCGGILRLRA